MKNVATLAAAAAVKKAFLFRATLDELGVLNAYAARTGRTCSDVLREQIRALGKKVRKDIQT